MDLSIIVTSCLSQLLITTETEIPKSQEATVLSSTKTMPMLTRRKRVSVVLKSWVAKSLLRSASATDLENPLPEDTWAGENHHQEESANTEEDLTLDRLTESTEDAEDTQATDKNNEDIEIVIVSIRKARGEIEIVQDLDRKNIGREDKADPIHPESDQP